MEVLTSEYSPPDEFIVKVQQMSFNDFVDEFCMEDWEKKKCRNAYDNRMRNMNLVCYYILDLDRPKTRTIGTQTPLSMDNCRFVLQVPSST